MFHDAPSKSASFFSKLKGYFFSGLLVSTPLLLTAYLVIWIVSVVDSLVRPLLPDHFSVFYGYFPGCGLIMTTLGATLIGAIMKGVLGSYVIKISEKILDHMPIVRGIYSTIKQISQAVLDKESTSFREVGLIEYPRSGIWTLCFVTRAAKGEILETLDDEMVCVFVPTTPNPTSGIFLFVAKSKIKILSMSVEDGIKMVVSLGVITPPSRPLKKRP